MKEERKINAIKVLFWGLSGIVFVIIIALMLLLIAFCIGDRAFSGIPKVLLISISVAVFYKIKSILYNRRDEMINNITGDIKLSEEQDYLIPSKDFEEKTHALSEEVFFSILLAIPFIYIIFYLLFKILEYIVNKNIIKDVNVSVMYVIFLSPLYIILALIFIIRLRNAFLITYKIEENRIIKGKIKNSSHINKETIKGILKDLEKQSVSSEVVDSDIIKLKLNTRTVRNRAILNSDPTFVSSYFSSDLYEKVVYDDIKFIKATKRYLMYESKGRKVNIPNIYYNQESNHIFREEVSLIKRGLTYISIITLIIIAGMFIGVKINSEESKIIKSKTDYNLDKAIGL